MMLDQFDPSDLLAFVEGTLPSQKTESLERLLSDDPGNLALLRRMRSDRIRLQAMPDPVPPHSLLAELESRFARPMLMADTAPSSRGRHAGDARGMPGQYGRRHRRQSRMRRIARSISAMAALVAVAVVAWWVIRIFPGQSVEPTADPQRAIASSDAGTDARSDARPERAAMPPPAAPDGRPIAAPSARPTAIVHFLPTLPNRPETALHAATPLRHGDIATAPLTLVINAESEDALERLLVLAIHGLDPAEVPVTLARTLSESQLYLAAARAAEEAIARSGRSSVPVGTGSTTGSGFTAASAEDRRLLLDALRAVRSADPAANEQETADGAVLAGSPEWRPSPEEQITLAARGATHVLTLRLDDLADLIRRLNQTTSTADPAASLVADASEAADRRSTTSRSTRWILEHARVREVLDQLGREAVGDERVIRVPIVRR